MTKIFAKQSCQMVDEPKRQGVIFGQQEAQERVRS